MHCLSDNYFAGELMNNAAKRTEDNVLLISPNFDKFFSNFFFVHALELAMA